MADINVTEEIIDINVTEEVITIAAANGAYPLAYPVYTVFGRTGAVVAAEGDYSLTQLSDVTLTSPANGQVLKYNGTSWVNSTDIDTGITTLNTLTALSQSFATGTSGTDFNISSASSTHTFNFPTASATNRGLLSSADWNTFNNKQNALTNPVTGTGTTNYLSKWTASGTIGNGNVFDNGNGVIIGGTTPISLAGTTYLSIQNNTLANSRGIVFYCNDGTQNPRTWIRHNTDSGNQYLAFDSTFSTAIGFANFAFLNGDVLINTTTDAGYKLDVNGTSRFVGNSIFDASIGIGTTSLTGYSLRVSKNITGATTAYGIASDGTIQSDVTSAAYYNRTLSSTQATTFTLGTLGHYMASQGTFGAGSTITNQYGFIVLSTLTGATNNYAFTGQLAAATNSWNLYMSGTANNYMAGSLGIGETSLTGRNLAINKNLTGSTVSISVFNQSTIQSDVTNTAAYFRSDSSTQAASFTLNTLRHYFATQATFGAGSTVLSQIAFDASAALIGGTTNYGFKGAIPAGIGRFNLFMDGTAENYLAGNVGIGGAANNVSAGACLTATITDGGSGYVDGTYTDVATTAISTNGGGVRFSITVVSGVVTNAVVTWGGQNYKVGDTFTIANTLLGGTGSGLILTVASVDFSQLKISSTSTTGTDLSLFRSSTSLAVTNPYGSIKFEGNDASTSAAGVQAKIGAYAAGSSGGAYLSFFTSTGSGGALTEAVRIGNGGQVGIGGAYSLTGYSLRISKDVTGSTSTLGVQSDGVIQSGVTSQFVNFRSFPSTAAASFTLTDLIHFNANQSTIGLGSTVTTQYGFNVSSTLTGATTNYGFFGNIAAGTGRWNLFMNGTAENYLAGNVGIGNSPNFVSAGTILTTTLTNGGSGYVNGTYTDVAATNISSNGVYALFTIVVSGGVVTTATLTWGGTTYRVGDTLTVSNTLLGGTGSGLIITVATVDSSILTIASTTGSDITLYRNDTSSAAGENIGTIKWESRDSSSKSSGIGAEIGAFSAGTLGGAYLSFFTRSVSAGTSLVEAMRIDSRGGVGIGATVLTEFSLKVSKNITGATSAFGIQSDGTIQSDVTSQAFNFRSQPSTAAASFTLGSLYHYGAVNGTLGAGSTITDQFGYWVSSSFTNGTNNYAFYSSLSAGANRWNIYMNGTANNYMAGSLGIGSTALTGFNLRMQLNLTGATTVNNIWSGGAIQSDVTSGSHYFRTNAQTQAATFTIGSIYHYSAIQSTIGAGSTVTNQFGFFVDTTLIGATNNYGYYGNIASGTNRWNLYMNGTAQNYLAGNTGIGVAAKTTAELSLGAGTTAQAQINLASSTAPTSPQDGDIWFDGTALKIRIGGVTKTVTVT